jgi:uncharacterized membrane protein
MLPNPLHPALVHFPIVFTMLFPLAVLGAFWLIRKKVSRAWLLPVAAAAALSLSAWLAVRTGEAQEEKVESAVSEGVLHTHEEAGERFLLLSLGVLGITALGLLGGKAGSIARGAALAGSLGVVAAGYQVGHSGGELVYRHGAASAYVEAGGEAGSRATNQENRDSRGEDDDDDDRRGR